MVPRESKNNAYAKFGPINKEYYGIFQSGLLGLSFDFKMFSFAVEFGYRPFA